MKKWLVSLLILTAILRLNMLDYPRDFVFDEVYHGFTAKEYAKGSKEAWEWWTTPPPKVAFEWTHPPLAKELMAASVLIFRSDDFWVLRLPGALLGILSVLMVYLITKNLFSNQVISLTAAFIFSLDGLNFVQSRTAMNDIYFVAFMLISLFFFLRNMFNSERNQASLIISAVFLGLTMASKWTGIYLLGMFFILLILNRSLLKLFYFILIPPIIYLITYIPFFLLGHTIDQFIELHKQMWWYHINLKATHDYASFWWSWPLNLYPVWYFVEYHKNNTISNIFASGNPIVFWSGIGAIITIIIEYLRTRAANLFIILLGFFIFWLPWAISPRIMFLYHYSPSVPFLSIALGYYLAGFWQSKKDRVVFISALVLIGLGFLMLYPFLTGVPLPKDLLQLFFRINLTKNPFG